MNSKAAFRRGSLTETTASTTGTDEQEDRVDQQPKVQAEVKDDSVDEDLYQDSVSQFPFLNGYADLLYGFQTNADIPRDAVVTALRNAFRTITDQIPLLAGQVVHVPGEAGSSGVYQPAPWPVDEPRNEILRVKECDDLMSPMTQILRANAPIAMLPGKILTPWPSLPLPHGLESPLPVIAAQANFIRGGLLLNMSMHHIAIDGAGLVQVMRLLSTVLSGREIPSAELEQANRDRRRVVPLIPHGEPVKDHTHLRRPPGYIPPLPKSPAKWCYFKVPLAGLPALRKAARLAPNSGSEMLPVSDNDILCAFCWQRISVARLARGISADTMVKLTRAIDGRSALGIPSSYLGHLIHHSITRLPLGRVASSPLSAVTQALRRELKAANTPWAIRSYATFVAREPDKSQLVYGGLRDINIDLGATSVVSSAGDEAASAMPDTFGLLGRPCFMRRPDVSPIIGTFCITPAEGGALPFALCLPNVDLEALKKDVEWRRYTRYIG
ncbi:MAG: hypothetical protein LQ338_003195 [Usnochroma carphineum]|nr:MAG: hypothetical protein LQ338_003195 [Usnochroma carphineum]